ncbi:retrovirus-related pol polyprotein from transposon TNT 1-94 [Tanacetum coccineum]|uniref:Retrovirus-related pol polyprotein from transposon TNT 1-94 n=1 Tax=Tanacetum coccineum TaxID=301880 RepID=A0ABQ4Z2S4_9ASTR
MICQDAMNIVMHANDHSDNVLPTNNNSLEHDNSAFELLKHENDLLIELLISQDLVHIAVNSLAAINDYKSMQQSFSVKSDMLKSKIEEMWKLLISKVAFRKHTCYVRNLNGDDLLSGSKDKHLYIISLDDILKSSPIYMLSKASKSKSWLWHRRLSHLNFDTLNQLAKQGLVQGLTKLKFEKDHLCLACSLGKSKKSSQKPKADDTNQEKLHLLHMDLCGPMRVESINGKKYIMVIVDDYSRFMWVKFLRTKDEAPEVIIKCLKQIQVHLNATVRNVRTNN